MKTQRYQGEWPKIGIRPTIDGRMGGVRESLEVQTMNMAKGVVDFLGKTLKYPDGTPVQFVIADSTIGRVAESAACAEKFKREGVAITITVTPCWCYGSETMDMTQDTIKAVWGFNGTERPGAVYLAAVLAAHAQKGLPAFGIYGHDVQDGGDTSIPADVQEKLLLFSKAALAAAIMRGKSYLSVGAVCMGIAGSIVNTDFFEDYLGMRCEGIDEVEIIRRMTEGIYDKEEFEKALAWAKANCKQGEDNINRSDLVKTPAESAQDWEFIVKMTLIVRDLMIGNPKLKEMGFGEEALGHNAIAAGFQGQRQWTDFYPNGDFTEAILNSSFDWNGIRAPFVLATENDACNGTAMLFGNLLTNTASIFADVRTYWSPEAVERVTGWKPTGLAKGGMIHLINSGAASLDGSGYQNDKDGQPTMKSFWDITEADAQACLDATTWMPANREYFRGGGYSSKFLTRGGMPCTMIRLNLVKGLGPVLQIAEGWTADIDPKAHHILDERTDKGWPTTWFVPRIIEGNDYFKDVYSVMNNWGANHGAINGGHIGAELITLASILRIPVCMHNVPEEKIYRPSVWNAFGMNKEGADYRACQTYGPLYKK
ncbi:MAG: L-fucose isomerase [Candidatus Ordinivivax streblomastigis]|uniref:L-fucose isomerase n=1 Tax=Candidatus Ordinivivax streblomastigis TaxID=2540710 RepID=A0A5M8P1N0_9BACT|nr:MAG: L-fucose isomerase [Candidatus Ordinivivax streblomastigis]